MSRNITPDPFTPQLLGCSSKWFIATIDHNENITLVHKEMHLSTMRVNYEQARDLSQLLALITAKSYAAHKGELDEQ